MKILNVVGARPNFMKIAPLIDAIKKHNRSKRERKTTIDFILVHTGQHYDEALSQVLFDDLQLPQPDIYLKVGSGTHGEQTGKIMMEFEKVCLREKPDLLVVVGDVNSTIACALVAAKLHIPVAHIEAGLRSFDRTMPEEINRILTDQLSDYLFTTCDDAKRNLMREGISPHKIFFVGNVMIDTLLKHVEVATSSNVLERLGIKNGGKVDKYAAMTLHRPSNVDDSVTFKRIYYTLKDLSKRIPIIFPAHPRTMKQMIKYMPEKTISYQNSSSLNTLEGTDQRLLIIPPLGYIDFLCLMSNAIFVLTDSGGIQEETTILGIPCLTMRENTERPITVKEGTNILVGSDREKILRESLKILSGRAKEGRIPKFWDGKTAERIVNVLLTDYDKHSDLGKVQCRNVSGKSQPWVRGPKLR